MSSRDQDVTRPERADSKLIPSSERKRATNAELNAQKCPRRPEPRTVLPFE